MKRPKDFILDDQHVIFFSNRGYIPPPRFRKCDCGRILQGRIAVQRPDPQAAAKGIAAPGIIPAGAVEWEWDTVPGTVPITRPTIKPEQRNQ